MPDQSDDVMFRRPKPEDGLELHRLIAAAPPLDLNSIYSYCLFGAHFADTSIVAIGNGQPVGFISGYRIPHSPDTLFIWQVAVNQAWRGRRIAWRMLTALLSRFDSDELRHVEASVNPSNLASRGLFERLAVNRGSKLTESAFLGATAFGSATEHEPEILLHIPLHPR